MGPKTGGRVRKIKVPTDSVPEFELGDTVANIQQMKEEKDARERDEAQREEESRREETREEETHKRRELEKIDSDQKSDTETEARGEAGPSQSQDERGVHDQHISDGLGLRGYCGLVKNHEELCDKTIEHFKDKAKKECLWEQFANSRKLSVKV